MKRAWILGIGLSLGACGDDPEVFGPYDDENVAVIGTSPGEDTTDNPVIVVRTPDGDCIAIANDICVPVADDGEWCERDGGPTDVVIVDGEVAATVCYPPAQDGRVTTVSDAAQGDIDIVQNANGTAVIFDEDLNGQPIVGDVSVDGNNVSIFGNGPENTIIDGDVVISGNNVRIRGVTITGNLTIGLNSAAVLLSRVYGNVEITKNNTIFVDNDVYGNVSVTANNTLLIGNDVQGTWSITGSNSVCDGNAAFTDPDGDYEVDSDERGDALPCD